MILSTHAIVGGAIASLMPGHPVFAFVTGAASHFAIDAIPHVDYPLYSITVNRSANSALTVNWLLLRDFGLITLDAFAGLAIVLWLYASPGPSSPYSQVHWEQCCRTPCSYCRSFIHENL
jgi:hypothetical protein